MDTVFNDVTVTPITTKSYSHPYYIDGRIDEVIHILIESQYHHRLEGFGFNNIRVEAMFDGVERIILSGNIIRIGGSSSW